MKIEELKEFIKTKAYEGEDYLTIKKALNRFALSEEETRKLLMKADEYIIDYQLAEQARSNYVIRILMGSLISILGIVVTYVSYVAGGDRFYIWFGAIIGGAWLVIEGYKKFKLPVADLLTKPKEKKPRIFDRF